MGTARGLPIISAASARAPELPPDGDHEIVVVGAPVEATQAAHVFLVGLPATLTLPLVLLLSGACVDDRERLVSLQAHCALPVRLIDDKDPILSGCVHVAPTDYHLLVEEDHFALSTAGPVKDARPAIDVLFASVADEFGDRAVCVLLGRDESPDSDGHLGATKVRARGGLVIVENPATAAVGGRADPPLAAATVLHLSEIAPFVSALGPVEVA